MNNNVDTMAFTCFQDTICKNCGEDLIKGQLIYQDKYRDEDFCENCEDDYWQEVENEEGDCGRLLK